MAKRRRRKKRVFKYNKELIGIILIIIAVLGFGNFGVAGKFIHWCGILLVGNIAFYILFASFIVIGLLLLFKGDDFDFFSMRMIGCYLLFLGLIIIFHKPFFDAGSGIMFTVNNTMDHISNTRELIMNNGKIVDYFYCGGGIIGGSLAAIFVAFFSKIGMIVISSLFMLLGVLLIIGLNTFGIVKDKISDKVNELEDKKEEKAKKKENKKLEEEEEKERKLSQTQVLITGTGKKKEEPQETVHIKPKEVVINENYQLPPIDLLNTIKEDNVDESKQKEAINNNIELLQNVLKDFGISSKVVEVHVGPTVCQYELEIASGTRVNKITSINREIALALAKKDVRIEAPIPGKKTVGIEFANDQATAVPFREIIDSNEMKSHDDDKLLVSLGKTIMGDIGTCRIDKMPHLLIAGTTGSGKSVCINGIICSILMRTKPEEVKLAMVDPKVVELSVYNGVPHLIRPVVNDPREASNLLKSMVQEMEHRYQMFADTHTKNIETYNKYVEKENKKHNNIPKMPYVVIIIDELADLMMVAAKDVEDSILRITQKARAAGMHLVVATQRPSTEVITGLIKANIPSRIAFAVGSGIDSRTILDMTGAEKLLGKGDMLYLPLGDNTPTRIQGAFITDDEIRKICDFVKEQQKPNYDEKFMNLSASHGRGGSGSTADLDEYFGEVVDLIQSTKKASASMIQRKFQVGYNRAGRIIDQLEEQGVIFKTEGSNAWVVNEDYVFGGEAEPAYEDNSSEVEEDKTEETKEEVTDDVVDVKVKEKETKVIADEEDDGENLLDSVE